MHREPRGAESAEIAFGEVRLPVGAGKAKYPRTFSALRNLRGCFCNRPKRSGTALLTPSRCLTERGGFLFVFGGTDCMFDKLKEEIASIKARDPAVRSFWEVLFLYPSFKAVRSYRRAHWFHTHGHPFIARWISQRSRHKTGIEIHPGAKIGKNLFIDHGAGVVIGETTEIGDNCTLYQNVTLGGTGKDVGKRHPTLGNNVMVGAGARVLGPFKIGDNSKIAANAVVLEEVPPNCTAVGVPARVVRRDGVRVNNSDLDQIHIPDPVSQLICQQQMCIDKLNQKVDELKEEINELKEKK